MVDYTEQGLVVDGELITYEAIDKERNKFRFANHVLVTMTQQYSRDDYVDQFIMDKDSWAKIKARLLDHGDLYIGEIAGKHSEVIFYPEAKGAIKEEFDLDKIVSYFEVSGWGDEDMNVRECLDEAYEGDL